MDVNEEKVRRRRVKKQKKPHADPDADVECEYVYVDPENQVLPSEVELAKKPLLSHNQPGMVIGGNNTQPVYLITHRGSQGGPKVSGGSGLIELPKRVELQMPGGPIVSKFEKRKKRAKAAITKVYQDAANSCEIEIDDLGTVISVMLSDDLAQTFIKFGKQEMGDVSAINLHEGAMVPLISKKKPWTKSHPRQVYQYGESVEYTPFETLTDISQNRHYKKIRVKKQKVKSKKTEIELLFAANKADLVVEEYCDKVGKIYVAFPDKRKHLTYLFALPERLNVVAEEYSKEIPIRRAVEDKADWYVQDTSSEESEEEPDFKPIMHEAVVDATEEQLPVRIKFKDSDGDVLSDWPVTKPLPSGARLIMH